MPLAVTHILLSIILVSLFRDFYIKNKSKFHLHYVLIAGLGALIPDIDILLFWITRNEELSFNLIQTHTLFIPLTFFFLFLILKDKNINAKVCNLTRHKLRLSVIFLMITIGTLSHLVLDAFFGEPLAILFPLNSITFGINLLLFIPDSLRGLALPTLDGILLIFWIAYLEIKHKISSFI